MNKTTNNPGQPLTADEAAATIHYLLSFDTTSTQKAARETYARYCEVEAKSGRATSYRQGQLWTRDLTMAGADIITVSSLRAKGVL